MNAAVKYLEDEFEDIWDACGRVTVDLHEETAEVVCTRYKVKIACAGVHDNGDMMMLLDEGISRSREGHEMTWYDEPEEDAEARAERWITARHA